MAEDSENYAKTGEKVEMAVNDHVDSEDGPESYLLATSFPDINGQMSGA